MICLHAFSCAQRQLLVFASSSHWSLDCLRLLGLARVTVLVLVSRHSIENCSNDSSVSTFHFLSTFSQCTLSQIRMLFQSSF